MKAFKYLLFLLLIAIIGFAIFIAVQPNDFKVIKTRTIKAPAEVIYNNVIDFKNWKSWSSWVEQNPDIKITLPEQTTGINSSYTWEEEHGIGTIKTLETTPNQSINQQMEFTGFPSSNVYWQLKPNNNGSTDVIWTITGKDLPFNFKAYTALIGGMEKEIGPHYERSLEKLDSIVQESMKVYTININGETEYGGGFYIYKTTSANRVNISKIIEKQFSEIANYMSQKSIISNGMPFTIYNEINAENGNIIMSNAIPTRDKVNIDKTNDILCDYIPKTKVLKATLKGNYTNLPETWKNAMSYLTKNNLEQSHLKPFEIYTNDPKRTPNPANWITEIYIPIK